MKTALRRGMQGSIFIGTFYRVFAEKSYEALFVTLMRMCTNQKVSVCKGFGTSGMVKIDCRR